MVAGSVRAPSSSACSAVRLVVGLVAVASAACTGPSSATSTDPGSAVVVDVVDGDTLDLSIGGVIERVRLLGIDTPESVSTTTPDQCFGTEATEALRGLLPPDTAVTVGA